MSPSFIASLLLFAATGCVTWKVHSELVPETIAAEPPRHGHWPGSILVFCIDTDEVEVTWPESLEGSAGLSKPGRFEPLRSVRVRAGDEFDVCCLNRRETWKLLRVVDGQAVFDLRGAGAGCLKPAFGPYGETWHGEVTVRPGAEVAHLE